MKLTPPQVHYIANIRKTYKDIIIPRSASGDRNLESMDRNEGHSEANPSRRRAHILIKAYSCNVHAI
jgi:hypothetical protein